MYTSRSEPVFVAPNHCASGKIKRATSCRVSVHRIRQRDTWDVTHVPRHGCVIGMTHARHTTMRAAVARPAVSSAGVAGVASRAAPDSRRLPPRRALPPHQSVAYAPEYGDRTYDEHTRLAFSSGDAFVADVEQARVLWDHGWDVLDVRDEHEIDFFGDFPNPPPGTIGGCFETIVVSGPHKVRVIPMVTSTGYRFDSAAGGKVFANKTRNAGFKEAIAAAFPNKDEAKIMVSCSDGRQSEAYILAAGRWCCKHWSRAACAPRPVPQQDLCAPPNIQNDSRRPGSHSCSRINEAGETKKSSTNGVAGSRTPTRPSTQTPRWA